MKPTLESVREQLLPLHFFYFQFQKSEVSRIFAENACLKYFRFILRRCCKDRHTLSPTKFN